MAHFIELLRKEGRITEKSLEDPWKKARMLDFLKKWGSEK